MKIKTRRYYIYYIFKITVFCVALMPRKISIFLADLLGQLGYVLLRKHREIALKNLENVYGQDTLENERIVKDMFVNLVKTGVDWIKMSSCSKAQLKSMVTEIEGIEHLDNALGDGKGVIFLGSHFGNWELLSVYCFVLGYKGTVVAKKIYFDRYNKFIMRLRKRFGAKMVYREDSPKILLKALKKGEIVGLLADQDVDSVEGVFVDFFGKSAYTPVAPVKLGMTTEAHLMPAFMIRKKDNSYKMVMEKTIKLTSSGDKEYDILRYTQMWNDVVEKYVRKYPSQWVWIHRRWKSKKSEKSEKVKT